MNKAASTISDERRRSGPIVVGVDGSNASRRALEWAVREAEARGSGVLALSTYQMPAMAAAKRSWKRRSRPYRSRIPRFRSRPKQSRDRPPRY